MNTKQLSCAERIADEFATTEQLIAQELATDPASDEYYENQVEVYSVQRREQIRLQLSGGGPADFIQITHSDGDVISVEYLFQDWYDGASMNVPESSPVYGWAIQQLEMLVN